MLLTYSSALLLLPLFLRSFLPFLFLNASKAMANNTLPPQEIITEEKRQRTNILHIHCWLPSYKALVWRKVWLVKAMLKNMRLIASGATQSMNAKHKSESHPHGNLPNSCWPKWWTNQPTLPSLELLCEQNWGDHCTFNSKVLTQLHT